MRKTLCCTAAVCIGIGSVSAENDASFATFDRRARDGERLTVVFFGASLTWGANATDPITTSYRSRIAEKMQEHYPKAHFRFVDGAIGGTGSNLGVFRLERDCLAHKPDLVFLDFTANDDVYKAEPESLATYESLVRRVIKEGGCPLVMAVFPFRWNSRPGTADSMAGRLAHIEIAKAYNVPVGDAIVHIQKLTADDETIPDKVWDLDGVHPGDFGYRLFADAVWQGYTAGVEGEVVCEAPEAMLHADTYMTWSRNRISALDPVPAGWEPGLVSRVAAWYDGLMSRWLDDVTIARNYKVEKDPETKEEIRTPIEVAPISVSFKAASVLVFGEETTRSGKYEVYINGERISRIQRGETLTAFDLSAKRYGGNRQHYAVITTGLDTDSVHTLEIRPLFDADEVQELRLESICLAGGEARLVANETSEEENE